MPLKSPLFCVLVALAAQNGFADETVRQDIECGDRKLVVWTEKDYEEQHVIVWFHDKQGKETRPNIIAPGLFVPMCSRGVFLLFDNTGAHFIAGKSWLVSAKGEVLGGYNLGQYTVAHGVTVDESLVWVQSFEWDGKTAHTRVVAIGADGAVAHDKQYDAATRVSVELAGKSYTIDVIKPDLPD